MEFNGIIQQFKKKKKERSSDPGCNMDEPWRCCPERNTWDTEGQGLYDSTTVRYPKCCCYCLVTRSCPTLCNSVDRLPCPSLSLGVCSDSCPLSQWCHPTILSLCHPLLLLPSIFPSIRVFFNKLALCIRQQKYWSFGFSVSPSNEYSEWVSFRIDCSDLTAVQGTLENVLQHHSSKVSILWHSAFFMI